MIKNPGDGIYYTRANWFRQTGWPEDRIVYIQGDTVRLVQYLADPRISYSAHLFGFDHWFEANELGERVGDLPENFNIRVEPTDKHPS